MFRSNQIARAIPASVPARDTHTRADQLTSDHARNWLYVGLVRSCITSCAVVLVSIQAGWVAWQPGWIVVILIATLTGGLDTWADRLAQYTEEARDALFGAVAADVDSAPAPQPARVRPGSARSGTQVRCPDNAWRPLSVDLTQAEQRAVAASLLDRHDASVRSLTAIVGDRASHLRDDLIRLGICAQPARANRAAPLTAPGRQAVQRW